MAARDLGLKVSELNLPKVPTKSIWTGGAVSGVVAGIFMAMAAMVVSYMTGAGFWLPPKLIAGALLGVDVIIGGVGTVTLGLVIHMMMSALLGIIFAFFTSRVTQASHDFVFGVLFGVAVWAVMNYVGLPLVNSVMGDRVAMMPLAWFVEHLVFGASLTLTPFFERASAPEEYRRVVSQRLAYV
jgi:hypothetical protein